jgi:methylene-tetrahydromethanopterin dehydrogenase
VKQKTGAGLAGKRVAVFGGTGVVGFSAAVLAAGEGADVQLVGYDGDARVKRSAADMQARFDVRVKGVDGSSEEKKRAIVQDVEVIFCAGPAGQQVLPEAVISEGRQLAVAADVNAVPPPGIAGIGPFDDGVAIAGTPGIGIGALAIGNVKYQTESGLFRKMIASDQPVTLDFRDAYALAQQIAGA